MSPDLHRALADSDLAGERLNLTGLFRIMRDVNVPHDYGIYTSEFKKATRSSISVSDQALIVIKSDVSQIRTLYQKALGLPGRYGIANLKNLDGESQSYRAYDKLLKGLIKNRQDSWVKDDDDDFWYVIENRDNTLINYSEKIFSVLRECQVDRLAEAYENALHARKYRYEFPSQNLISEYLNNSPLYEYSNGSVRYTGETTGLTEIEQDVVTYFRHRGEFTYPEMRDHLAGLSYGKPYIDRTIFRSPLIYVDRSGRQGNYVFRLVGELEETPSQTEGMADFMIRYDRFRALLKDVEFTDASEEDIRRREQPILQRWLFEGKAQETCAICGTIYSIRSLVTAHKKMRSSCSTEERLDPFIVMPLCLFGCDYLYENMNVLIENGVVTKGRPIQGEGREQSHIKKLIGREVQDVWLEGPQHYFRTLDD